MNLLTYLAKEVKDKRLTKAEAIRYIYLYTCEKYSFDYRYKRAVHKNNQEEMSEILNYKPSIKNANFKDITCVSYCESILGPLLEQILNIDVDYVGEGFGHRYLVVPFDGEEAILDATENDLTRVKLNMSTLGFESANLSDVDFLNNRLKNIDKKLGYIKDEYLDEKLKKNTKIKSFEDFSNVCNIVLNNYKLTNFFDASAAIRELFDVFFNDHIDFYSSHSVAQMYDYLGLYYADGMYYKLYKDGYYKFKPISLTEFDSIAKKTKVDDIELLLNPEVKSLKSI